VATAELLPRSTAPWTDDEVDSLNAYQQSGAGHEFTCGDDACRGGKAGRPGSRQAPLIAGPGGWLCRFCPYRQDGAHPWMANWEWEQFRWPGTPPDGQVPEVAP
jgi:hypothetical protein